MWACGWAVQDKLCLMCLTSDKVKVGTSKMLSVRPPPPPACNNRSATVGHSWQSAWNRSKSVHPLPHHVVFCRPIGGICCLEGINRTCVATAISVGGLYMC